MLEDVTCKMQQALACWHDIHWALLPKSNLHLVQWMIAYHVGSKRPTFAKSARNRKHTIAKVTATGILCNSYASVMLLLLAWNQLWDFPIQVFQRHNVGFNSIEVSLKPYHQTTRQLNLKHIMWLATFYVTSALENGCPVKCTREWAPTQIFVPSPHELCWHKNTSQTFSHNQWNAYKQNS